MKWLLMVWILSAGSLMGCSYLSIEKDCAKVESTDSIGDNKFVCREVKFWD